MFPGFVFAARELVVEGNRCDQDDGSDDVENLRSLITFTAAKQSGIVPDDATAQLDSYRRAFEYLLRSFAPREVAP